MAGKHYGVSGLTGLPRAGTVPPTFPGSIEDRAYEEGRRGVPASNPHPAGSPAADAYDNGVAYRLNAEDQIQTGVA